MLLLHYTHETVCYCQNNGNLEIFEFLNFLRLIHLKSALGLMRLLNFDSNSDIYQLLSYFQHHKVAHSHLQASSVSPPFITNYRDIYYLTQSMIHTLDKSCKAINACIPRLYDVPCDASGAI